MRPKAERHVAVVRAMDVDRLWVAERPGITVGRPEHHEHAVALAQLLAMELCVARDPAVETTTRSGDPEELLDRLRDEVDLVDELLAQRGILVDEEQRVTGDAGRRVHASEQHEDGEVAQLVVREQLAVHRRAHHVAEQIVPELLGVERSPSRCWCTAW